MTQKQLATAVGVTSSVISQYETSAVIPSVETLTAIAQFFRVSADYLLGLTDSDRFDLSALTDEQAVAVLEIIRQFEQLNARQARDK